MAELLAWDEAEEAEQLRTFRAGVDRDLAGLET
jgi:hypothetical protein